MMGDRGMVNKKKKKKKDKKSLGYKQILNLVYSIVFCLLGFLVIRLGSVSYTQRDVYKRQR